MRFQLLYTKKAVTDLQSLDAADAKRIVKKLRSIFEQTSPLKQAKPLKGIYKGLFRFRIGNFRAIFSKDIQGNIILVTIIRVQHRKDVYE